MSTLYSIVKDVTQIECSSDILNSVKLDIHFLTYSFFPSYLTDVYML